VELIKQEQFKTVIVEVSTVEQTATVIVRVLVHVQLTAKLKGKK
jgi:hypothetical protein